MKIGHEYKIVMGGAVAGIKEKLQKLIGLEKANAEVILEGNAYCDIDLDEMKELISSEDNRLKKFREYIADGRLKSDMNSIVSAIGSALCEAEKVQRTYNDECWKTRLDEDRAKDRYEDARESDTKKRKEEKSSAKSEE